MNVQKIIGLGVWVACFFASSLAAAQDPAPPETMAQKALARDKVCTVCHNESWRVPVLTLYQTPHGNRADPRAPNCQTCHGVSDAHQKDPGGAHPDVVFAPKSKNVSAPEVQNEACLTCHKSGARTYWSGSEHQYRDLTCSNCHTVHVPHDPILTKVTQPEVCFACHKTQRAQIHYFSTHPILVGKVACSDCHNPHGSTAPKLLVKDTNCHTPHGSTKSPLLKARVPWLCQECHTGDHGAAINSGANLPTGNATTLNGQQALANQSPRAQTNARACLNCHVLIHGSNHPAGAKYQR